MVQKKDDMSRFYNDVQHILDAVQDVERDIDFLEENTDIDLDELPALSDLKEHMKALEIHAHNVLGAYER